MNSIPLLEVADFVCPASLESLKRYFGADRVEIALEGVRSACWLWNGCLLLEFSDHLETLPANPTTAARAVYPILREASKPMFSVPSCWPVQASSR